MTIVRIDASNESNFRTRKIMPAGRYTFEIANDPVVSKAKTSDNNVVSIELRCIDEGEYRGSAVFDNIPITPKTEFRLCHLVLAAGSQTKEEMQADGIDLSLLRGKVVEAEVGIEPPSVSPTGRRFGERNRIERYIFATD